MTWWEKSNPLLAQPDTEWVNAKHLVSFHIGNILESKNPFMCFKVSNWFCRLRTLCTRVQVESLEKGALFLLGSLWRMLSIESLKFLQDSQCLDGAFLDPYETTMMSSWPFFDNHLVRILNYLMKVAQESSSHGAKPMDFQAFFGMSSMLLCLVLLTPDISLWAWSLHNCSHYRELEDWSSSQHCELWIKILSTVIVKVLKIASSSHLFMSFDSSPLYN